MSTEKELYRRTRYLTRLVHLACDFALHGPAWLPAGVRRIPLSLLLWFMSLHLVGL